MDDWLIAHMPGVLLGIEIMWVGGFLAVFVLYFLIWHAVRKKRKARWETKPPEDKGDD